MCVFAVSCAHVPARHRPRASGAPPPTVFFSHSSPAVRAWQQQCQLKLWGQSPSVAHVVPFLFGGMSLCGNQISDATDLIT